MDFRDSKGRFSSKNKPRKQRKIASLKEHSYSTVANNRSSQTVTSDSLAKNNNLWKEGRKLIELDVLLENLRFCQKCFLGPVPLTIYSIKGELPKGLGGYFYVQCGNHDCGYINTVAYGKTYREPGTENRQGMGSFAVNTKLGIGMYHMI